MIENTLFLEHNMKIFITGTDTNIGKTLISSWLTMHSGYAYFKPIQTGTKESSDSKEVQNLTAATIIPEIYTYPEPVSPHLAAQLAGDYIDIAQIALPNTDKLIVEGAGGLLVPINAQVLMIDLIKKLELGVILVASTKLGTINHTLLSIEALRARNIPLLGVIMNGPANTNSAAIAKFGNTCILADFPWLPTVTTESLRSIPLTDKLLNILEIEHVTI